MPTTTNLPDNKTAQEDYASLAGRKAAEYDAAQGTLGYHRNASESAAYVRAYDAWCAYCKRNAVAHQAHEASEAGSAETDAMSEALALKYGWTK